MSQKIGLGIASNLKTQFTKIKIENCNISINSENGINVRNINAKDIELDTNDVYIKSHINLATNAKIIEIPDGKNCGIITVKINSGISALYIVAGNSSSATIVENVTGEGPYRGGVVVIDAHEHSNIKYCTIQRIGNSDNYFYRKANVHSSAKMEWLDITIGGKVSKYDTISNLIGDGASTNMYSIFFANKNQQLEILNKANHIGINTQSSIQTTGALKDKSKSITQGFAKIGKKAYGAIAHQKSKTILLNEGTKATPIPKLEIDNNDVAATHEASVGQIDEEKLFYMMSRGLNNLEAKKIYIEGFFEQQRAIVGDELDTVLRSVEEKMKND